MNTAITRVPFANSPPPIVTGAGMTHRGRVRDENQDTILTDPEGVIWAVADGMGGHGHGSLASDIVIDLLSVIPDTGDPVARLTQTLQEANRQVVEKSLEPAFGQMGSTVVATLIDGAIAHVAWVGDSRAYLYRRGHLRIITRDHSLVQELVETGQLDPRQAESHPEAHVVTRAVGGAQEVEVDIISVPLFAGDRILMCSDGMTKIVAEQKISDILWEATDEEQGCLRLVTAALEAGAPDNVSVVLIAFKDAGT